MEEDEDFYDPEDDEVTRCIECGHYTVRDYGDVCEECWIKYALQAAEEG